MSDDFTATVRKIANGYIILHGDQEYFTPKFDIANFLKEVSGSQLTSESLNHEKVLINMVMAFVGCGDKIPAIKAVRDYCINNNYDKYRGLKEAKEYVEGLRDDWYRDRFRR